MRTLYGHTRFRGQAMTDETTPTRRRKLPVLGITTVGLAVGAGSLGLYRGATAVPNGSPNDQPT